MTSHTVPNLKFAVIGGGAAGALTVTGIRGPNEDYLESVLNITDQSDITSEFSITADDTIDNTGGGTTATDTLLVVWAQMDVRGGDLNRS